MESSLKKLKSQEINSIQVDPKQVIITTKDNKKYEIKHNCDQKESGWFYYQPDNIIYDDDNNIKINKLDINNINNGKCKYVSLFHVSNIWPEMDYDKIMDDICEKYEKNTIQELGINECVGVRRIALGFAHHKEIQIIIFDKLFDRDYMC